MDGLLLDGLIVLLLTAVLVLGGLLHRRLQRLRSGDGELARLVESLNGAVARAESVLSDLRRMALECGERLDRDRTVAQGLVDDLKMLSDRAEREADRLADAVRSARPVAEPGRPVAAPASRAKPTSAADPEELEQALRSLR